MVNNYTGDRLTFGLAERRCKNTTMQMIADDCTTKHLRIGARGLAGNLFHYKIAGAMAELGHSVPEIKQTLDSVKPRVATIGVCFQACTMPGKSGYILDIEPGYAELGLGVHGESGVEKVKVSTCVDLIGKMLVKIMHSFKEESVDASSHKACLLVNNLGAMSQVEMGLITKAAVEALGEQYNLYPVRLYVGTFMTSLDSKGFSLSVFVAKTQEELDFLDAECNSPIWTKSLCVSTYVDNSKSNGVKNGHANGVHSTYSMPQISMKAANLLRKICQRLLDMTDRLDILDGKGFGDGDCGSTLAKMWNRILIDLDKQKELTESLSNEQLIDLLYYLSKVAENEMGGTSGGLYAFGFQSASDAIKTFEGDKKNLVELWCDIADSVLWAVQFLGGAQPGDRSLVDPLDAIAKCIDKARNGHLSDAKGVLHDSAVAAEKAAEATSDMKANVGRAAAARHIDDNTKHPDPGATALAAAWAELVANL